MDNNMRDGYWNIQETIVLVLGALMCDMQIRGLFGSSNSLIDALSPKQLQYILTLETKAGFYWSISSELLVGFQFF